MADTASLFSDTSTLYDVPILQSNGSDPFLPIEDCFAILFIHHDLSKVDPSQLTRAGLPSVYDKSSTPSGSRSALAKVKLKKDRLQVQFPKASLQHAIIDRKEDITTVEQVRKMMQAVRPSRGRLMTMFDSLEDELVGTQTRIIMDVALAFLFRCSDVRNPILFYPASSVLLTPNWAVSKERGMATSDASWATISFMSPAKTESIESKEDAQKRYLADLTRKETEQDILQRLFIPSQESEQLLRGLLNHLESRGAIWSKAGHATRPSIKNGSPKDRPEFVVLGLFPKPFVNRCKIYHRKGGPMPSDLEEGGKSKYAPLITTTASTTSNGSGKDVPAASSEDYLTGWSIRLAIEEPYRTGSARQEPGMVAIGGVGGFIAC
jgi:hypothetical protein